MSVCVPIFGVPRSGTTLAAQIVDLLGVPMSAGQWVEPADPSWTKTHFYADKEFAELHDELTANMSDAELFYGMEPKNAKVWDRYQALIETREAANEVWGIKDVWLPLLWPAVAPRLNSLVLPIFVSRDPNASADSYAARKGDVDRQGAKDRLAPWTAALAALRGVFPTALVVSFESLTAAATKGLAVDTIAGYLSKAPRQVAVDAIDETWVRW